MDKATILKLREAAQATCGNSFLMDDGRILTKAEYKGLGFAERLRLVAYYQYSTSQIVKI